MSSTTRLATISAVFWGLELTLIAASPHSAPRVAQTYQSWALIADLGALRPRDRIGWSSPPARSSLWSVRERLRRRVVVEAASTLPPQPAGRDHVPQLDRGPEPFT